jgi:hypothetical protein
MAGDLPRDGLVAVVKRDCPTCVMAAPILGVLARQGGLTVYTQDDPSFPKFWLTGSTTERSTSPTSSGSRWYRP